MVRFTHSAPGRLLVVLLVSLHLSAGCSGPALAPTSGSAVFLRSALVAVPGAVVNTAGGNLMVGRVDLVVDSLVGGSQSIGAIYDAKRRGWLWAFQVTYDGSFFLDPSGRGHDLGAVEDGSEVPGTVWVREDADTVRTAGGLAYHFDEQARLARVAWHTLDFPRIEYAWSNAALDVSQCVTPQACAPLFAIDLDPDGRPTRIVGARLGRVVEYDYDADGALVRVRDPQAMAEARPGTSYEYDAGGFLTAITNAQGERIEYAYQSGGRIDTVTQIGEGDPTHRFRFYARDYATGFYPTVHTNPLGARTRYSFDGGHRLHEILLEQTGERHTLAWTGRRLASDTRTDGTTTSFAYDGNLETRTLASGNIVRILYRSGGLNLDAPLARPIERIWDDEGLLEERVYDAVGRSLTRSNGEGDTVAVAYNGSVIASVTDPGGATRDFPLHGIHGHWLEMTGAGTARRSFDPVGNEIIGSQEVQRGGVLTRGYDANRNIVSVVVGATSGGVVTATGSIAITRRSDGRPTLVQRPGGGDHEFHYDALGRLIERRERADGQWNSVVFEYDAAGHHTATTLPNGMRQEIAFDGYGRVVSRRQLRNGVVEGEVSFGYAGGVLATVTDSVRGTESYAYDFAGRLASVSYPSGELALLEHDLRSRRVRETLLLPGDETVADLVYEYDRANRQRRVVDRTTGEALLDRTWLGGRIASTATGNGLTREWGYDAITGLLTETSTRDGAGNLLEQTHVERSGELDPPRQEIRVATETALASTAEHYWLTLDGSFVDPDTLVGKRVFGWSDGGADVRDFVHDETGNLETDTQGNAFTYNPERNRLQSAAPAGGGTSLAYTYDEAGFVTSRGGLALRWSPAGQLAGFGPDWIDRDAQGRPLAMEVGGIASSFALFAGAVETDPQSGAPQRLDLGEVVLDLQGGAHRYRHFDFRENVSFVTDASGAVITHYRYAPYAVDAVFGSGQDPVRFAGRRAFGPLALLGARAYDPAVGRFLSPDPILALANQYAYTSGNPVGFADASGLLELALSRAQVRAAATIGVIVLGGVAVSPLVGPVLGAWLATAAVTAAVGIQLDALREASSPPPAAPPPPASPPGDGPGSQPTIGPGGDVTVALGFPNITVPAARNNSPGMPPPCSSCPGSPDIRLRWEFGLNSMPAGFSFAGLGFGW